MVRGRFYNVVELVNRLETETRNGLPTDAIGAARDRGWLADSIVRLPHHQRGRRSLLRNRVGSHRHILKRLPGSQ
jgi:hypothetical protein